MTRHRIVAWVVLAAAAGCSGSHRRDPPEDAARPVDAGARDGCGDGACCSDGVACVVDVECCSGSCSAGLCSSEVTCGPIDDAGDCTAFGCAWVVPEGCFDEIDPAWVNGCVRSVGATCAGDLDCPSGERCRPFAIDPCAGLPCDACFAEERRCVAD